MSMPITTGSFSKALWPGVNAWYGEAYNEYPVEFDKDLPIWVWCCRYLRS